MYEKYRGITKILTGLLAKNFSLSIKIYPILCITKYEILTRLLYL